MRNRTYDSTPLSAPYRETAVCDKGRAQVAIHIEVCNIVAGYK